MSAEFMQSAFDGVCKEAKLAKGAYVSLMVKVPYYGGSEEGGWWGYDTHLVKYQWYQIEEEAQAAKDRVLKLADELGAQAKREDDAAMARSCEWLEQRGLDANFMPEPDGPEEYYVVMSDHLPSGRTGSRQYE